MKLLAIVAFSVVLVQAQALKCWECKDEAACVKDGSLTGATEITCPESEPSCMKSEGKISGLEATLRGCSSNTAIGCVETESGDDEAETCICQTDLCNSAPKMGAILGLLAPICLIVTRMM